MDVDSTSSAALDFPPLMHLFEELRRNSFADLVVKIRGHISCRVRTTGQEVRSDGVAEHQKYPARDKLLFA